MITPSVVHPIVSEAGMRIMRLLIGRPPLTMTDLMTSLNVTRTAVTEQLDELIAIGLIEQKQEHIGGRGRPRYRFSATEAAMRKLFEGLQGQVVPATWRAIRKRFGEEVLETICQDVAADSAGIYLRQLISDIPKERLREFVTLQSSLGRLIEFRDNGNSVDIRKFNCPFASMADHSGTVCRIDLLGMQLIAGGDKPVKLVESRYSGYPCCVFRLAVKKGK
jgi:predicted ArsR family transcriptional regulator